MACLELTFIQATSVSQTLGGSIYLSMENFITQFLANEEATLAFAARFARAVGDTAIIFLHGELGVGKTTFSRGFLRGLGYHDKVKSPTYTIVEPYILEQNTIYHFDLYRIHHPEELAFIGLRDYFVPKAICLIEWPSQGGSLLPEPDLSCYIEFAADGRQIKLIAHSARGEAMLKKF